MVSAAASHSTRWGGLGLATTAIVYAVWLLALARGQWFVTDEFAYLAGSSDPLIAWLFTPHNEHSIATTKLWFNTLFPIVGLRHYFLYLLPLVVAHLVAIAAIYRLTWIASASRVVATGTALIAAMMGAGAGTLTWAGQFQQVGALAAGLVALVLALEPQVRRRTLVVAVIALFGSLTGTAFVAIGLAVAAAFAYRRRWTETALLSGIPLTWLLVVRLIWAPSNAYGAGSLEEVLRLGPTFAFTVLDTAVSQTFAGTPITAAVLVALIIGVLNFLSRRPEHRARLIVGALALATLLSMLALVVGRLQLSQSVASGGGYSYLLLITIIPLIGAMLGRPARSKGFLVAGGVIAIAISMVGYGKITDAAHDLSEWRLQGARLMQASAHLLTQDAPVYPDEVPVPDTAPTVTQAMISSWEAAGALDAVSSGQVTSDQASLNMQWRLVSGTDTTGECPSLGTGEHVDVPPGAELSVSPLGAGTALAVGYPDSPAVRRFELPADPSTIQSAVSRAAIVSVASGSARICTVD